MGQAKYTNEKGISLPLAVWLAHDEYNHDPRPNLISVTTLIKPVKQIILESRLTVKGSAPIDISTRLASRLGTAVHNSVEYSWTTNYKQALIDLGYPKRAVEAVRVNPTEGSSKGLDVYLEIRSEKQVDNWIVSGQFDMVYDGAVNDIKSTGTWTYTSGIKDDDYIKQLSIYKWLNPDIITKNTGAIQFIFKDWSALKAITEKDKGYPPMNVLEYRLQLTSVSDINTWITNKLLVLNKSWNLPESELTLCTAKELNQKPSVWKHYASAESKRATPKGTFNTAHAAYAFLATKGKGIVKEIRGEVSGCRFCLGKEQCTQYKQMVIRGEIKS